MTKLTTTGGPSGGPLLASLAIVKANWDYGRGYLDNFVPFLLDAVKASGEPAPTLTRIREVVAARFGIALPDGVINTLVVRATRAGYGTREAKTFVPNAARLAEVGNLDVQRADWLRRQAALNKKLVAFAQSRYGLTLGEREAESELLKYIEDHAAPLLRSVVAGSAYQGSGGKEGIEYVLSAFIADAVSAEPDTFEHLDAVIKGSMLSSSLYLPQGTESGQKFTETTVYLDTPILLRALGHEGDEPRQAIRDLMSLCLEAGASVACFAHTVAEARGVIEGASQAMSRTGRPGGQPRGVEAHFAAIGASASDVVLVANALDSDLLKLGIRVVEKPSMSHGLSVDETKLEETLESQVLYPRRNALLYDIDSLTAIHRLRGGRSGSRLETCKAILVTSNRALVQAATGFFVRHDEHDWSPAITEHHLATLVWLKKPQSAPDLPKRQVLADCYAAMEPGAEVWQKYLAEIDRIEERGAATAQDIMALRYSSEAKRALMERTLGRPDQVSKETVEGILADARRAVTEPLEAERDAARADAAAESAARAVSESDRLAALNEVRGEREERQALEARIEAIERAHQAQVDAAKARMRRRLRVLFKVVRIGFVLLVVLGVISATPPLDKHLPDWLLVPAIVAGAAVAGLTVVHLVTGKSVNDLIAWAESRAAVRVVQPYLRAQGLDVPDGVHAGGGTLK